MLEAKTILERFNNTTSEKSKFRTLYQPVYDYGMPDRYKNINENKDNAENGKNTMDYLFSSCFILASDEFVQRFQSLVAPVNNDWIDFEAGYVYDSGDNERAKDEVNKQLAQIAYMCNVYKNTSNFDAIFTQFCYDLIAGTALICIQPGDLERPMTYSVLPFNEVNIEDGTNGEAIAYYRTHKLKNRLVKIQWRDIDYSYEKGADEKETEFLEATYYDDGKKNWVYAIIDKKTEKILLERISKTSPIIDLRWGKCSGETYGRGPGLKVIHDVITLNTIKEYSLRALAFSVPMFTGEEEGMDFDKIQVRPGEIIPVLSNATNKPSLTQLEISQMPDLMQFNVTQLEMDIKRAMFASTIPNDPNRKTTATEINTRVNELANSLNNAFGSLIDFLYRMIRRMIEVLQTFGYIPQDFDPKLFNGFGYKIKINTVLAAQQSARDAQQAINAIGVFAQFDPTMQMVGEHINLDKLIPYLADKLGIDNQFIRTEEEVNALRMERAKAMQAQQEQLAQTEVSVETAKEVGKVQAHKE